MKLTNSEGLNSFETGQFELMYSAAGVGEGSEEVGGGREAMEAGVMEWREAREEKKSGDGGAVCEVPV